MLERKQYLISLKHDGAYDLKICSEINELLMECADALIDDPRSSLLIHLGYLLPNPEDFIHILKKMPARMLITEPAANAYFEIPTCGVVDRYHESISGEEIPILKVDQEYSRILWEPISLLNLVPEWILDDEISSLLDLTISTSRKFSYYEIEKVRDLLEYPSVHALLCLEELEKEDLIAISKSIIITSKQGNPGSKKSSIDTLPIKPKASCSTEFERDEFYVDLYDPISMLQSSPPWLLELEISSLANFPNRLLHRCSYNGKHKASDMLQLTSEELLKWEGIGKRSLKDFSRSIIATIAAYREKKTDIHDNQVAHVTEISGALDYSNLTYEDWIKNADLEDPIAILHKAPGWSLDLKASTLLNLPIRLRNRLHLHGIDKVGDLLNHTSKAISKWPNIGRKSLTELSQSIISTIAAGQTNNLDNEEKNTSNFFDTNFKTHLNQALDLLMPREQKILRMRLGYETSNKPMTLEEVGTQFGVTRERIRQIEAKAYRKLNNHPLWRDGVIQNKVDGLMTSRSEPCYLDLAEVEDSWFEGFSNDTKCLADMIERACSGKYKTISIGGRHVISRIDGEDWEEAKQNAISILEEHLASTLTKDDVLLLIESHLRKFNAPELTSTVFDMIEGQIHFVMNEFGEHELASIGRGANSIVLAVLKASPTPLHYSEAHNRCIKMGYDLDIRRVHNALSEVGFLYALGTYGLKKHLPLSSSEKAELLAQLEDIILQGDPERQWNSAALLEQLLEANPETPEAVDKYIVNFILSCSKILKSLGRFVWVRSEHARQQNIDRIDLQEASTALIEKQGRPMSSKELQKKIREQRGISEYFLLKVTRKISRTSPGIWGLVVRDFHLPSNKIRKMLDVLYHHLKTKDQGIYIDEAKESLTFRGLALPDELTDYMIFSLSQTDPRFAVRRGQILGLAEWPTAKRLTIREASCKAALELHEFTCSADLRPRIEELIGRKVSENNQFNEGIRDAGFLYNETKHKWTRPE